jgi:hypothetical protein
MKEFAVYDPSGNLILFAESITNQELIESWRSSSRQGPRLDLFVSKTPVGLSDPEIF